jgi:hypothetical protein
MKVIGLFGMLLHVLNGLGYRQTMHDRSIPFQLITPLHFYVLHVGLFGGVKRQNSQSHNQLTLFTSYINNCLGNSRMFRILRAFATQYIRLEY